jgi:hypothetical protein
VLACNGRLYSNFRLAPAVDRCGVCGGDGNCIGCDGVADSGLRYDACGVCGGTGECLLAEGVAPVAVTFLFRVESPDPSAASPTFSRTVKQLAAACRSLQVLAATGQLLSPVRCVAADFVAWLESVEGRSYVLSHGGVENTSTLAHYAAATSRQHEVAFASEPATRIAFTTTVVQLPVVTVATNAALHRAYEEMVAAAASVESSAGAGIRVLQTSEVWASAVAAAVSDRSLRFSAGVGLGVTFGLIAVFFVSLRFAIIGTALSGFVLSGVLAAARLMGWDLDSTMQICVAVVLAVAAEHMVHLIDGYQDFVQTTQSHLFAQKTSRFHCVRGALVRTGLSTVTSAVAVFAVAPMFVVSEIQPLRRAGEIMITLHLLAVLASLFFCSWACMIGTTSPQRSVVLSLIVFAALGLVAGAVILALHLTGGVQGPSGGRVL